MRPARVLPLLAAALLASEAAADQAPVRRVRVAAAANVKPALDPIAAAWRAREPGVEVEIAYGASGALYAQIEGGAPFDLFVSADREHPERLAAAGRTDGPAVTYARGKLALWVPDGSPLDIERLGLAALRHPTVERVALANPRVAPYGRAALDALRAAGLEEALRPRLVLGQSAAQAAQFAYTGNAQAALLPLSLAATPPLSSSGRHVVVAGAEPVAQALVVVKGARAPELAGDLARFLLGSESRAIFARLGYELP